MADLQRKHHYLMVVSLRHYHINQQMKKGTINDTATSYNCSKQSLSYQQIHYLDQLLPLWAPAPSVQTGKLSGEAV
jgi:hypothetical protein